MRQFVSDVEEGVHTKNGWPNTCYGISKVGIIAMTRVIGRDYPHIMTNSVDPGYCATDQNANQGYISAVQGAKTAVALAVLPEDQKFISGKHLYELKEVQW